MVNWKLSKQSEIWVSKLMQAANYINLKLTGLGNNQYFYPMKLDEKNTRLLQAITDTSKKFIVKKMTPNKVNKSDDQSSEYYKLLHLWQEALEDYYQFFREIE